MRSPLFSKRAALALGLVLLMLLPLSSHAQEAEVIRTITNKFEEITNGWHTKLRPAVLYFFWSLAAISWAYTGITLALKGADMPELMSELVKIILITGFWLYVIENSVEICNAIINSLAKAAGIAGGGGVTGVAPGDIINRGLELANAVIDQGGFWKENDPFKKAQKKTVGVDILQLLPLSENTWQIEWSEQEYGRDGKILGKNNYTATATVSVGNNISEQTILSNPIGLAVDEIHLSADFKDKTQPEKGLSHETQ